MIGHEVIHILSLTTKQKMATARTTSIKSCLSACPHLQILFVESSSTYVKVSKSDGIFQAEAPGINNNSVLLNVKMKGINLTRDALNVLSRCLKNIKIISTSKGEQSIYDLNDTNKTLLDFKKFKELNKIAFDINHLIPKNRKMDNLVMHFICGEDDSKEETYYSMIPTNHQNAYNFPQLRSMSWINKWKMTVSTLSKCTLQEA